MDGPFPDPYLENSGFLEEFELLDLLLRPVDGDLDLDRDLELEELDLFATLAGSYFE